MDPRDPNYDSAEEGSPPTYHSAQGAHIKLYKQAVRVLCAASRIKCVPINVSQSCLESAAPACRCTSPCLVLQHDPELRHSRQCLADRMSLPTQQAPGINRWRGLRVSCALLRSLFLYSVVLRPLLVSAAGDGDAGGALRFRGPGRGGTLPS